MLTTGLVMVLLKNFVVYVPHVWVLILYINNERTTSDINNIKYFTYNIKRIYSIYTKKFGAFLHKQKAHFLLLPITPSYSAVSFQPLYTLSRRQLSAKTDKPTFCYSATSIVYFFLSDDQVIQRLILTTLYALVGNVLSIHCGEKVNTMYAMEHHVSGDKANLLYLTPNVPCDQVGTNVVIYLEVRNRSQWQTTTRHCGRCETRMKIPHQFRPESRVTNWTQTSDSAATNCSCPDAIPEEHTSPARHLRHRLDYCNAAPVSARRLFSWFWSATGEHGDCCWPDQPSVKPLIQCGYALPFVCLGQAGASAGSEQNILDVQTESSLMISVWTATYPTVNNQSIDWLTEIKWHFQHNEAFKKFIV